MAEARNAVGFRLGVTPDGGFNFEYDRDVFDLMFKAFVRTWTKCVARFATGLKNGIFPVKFELFGAAICVLVAIHLVGYDPTLGITHTVLSWFNITGGLLWFMSILGSTVITGLFWTALVRWSLSLLFSYQAWIYMSREQMQNPTLNFRVWSLMVKALSSLRRFGSTNKSGKPLLLAYQGSLPILPLPTIKETLRRHLESIRPFLETSEYDKFVQLSAEFEGTIANRLQRWLMLKRFTSDNYVSDWWEEYVYLRGRSPIMINSNYYCIDSFSQPPTDNQAARAGNVVNLAFQFRRLLLKQEATPIILQGLIPMCSNQYERFFNTTRIPGIDTDTLVHLSDSTHVAVMHKGRFFRLCCYNKGRLLNAAELQKQIQGILDDNSEADEGEQHLAVLTASNRTTWAETRNRFFSKGINKLALDVVEKAAFVLVLDDYEYGTNNHDSADLSRFGALILHGKCSDRWFDKSIQICVGTNGRIGANGEHSWADAPVVGHFWEYLLANDLIGSKYDPEGNCFGSIMDVPPKARKLRWEIPVECQTIINNCLKEAKLLADDLHLHILFHNAYGKGLMKSCNISPDAYIQMALQLAYFRDAGKFCLTYEASMTRLFKEGRTETVRPCTMESVEWARSMDSPQIRDQERVELLRNACKRHQRGYQEAMTGEGIDRHLFALYVVSKYLNKDSEFLRKVLGEPWMLSTSQTPVRGEFADIKKHPELLAAGGGFGPVADDGYGVSYIITGEDCIFFHVSCKRKCPQTNAERFAKRIETALADIKILHQNLKVVAEVNGNLKNLKN